MPVSSAARNTSTACTPFIPDILRIRQARRYGGSVLRGLRRLRAGRPLHGERAGGIEELPSHGEDGRRGGLLVG
jgi:hypothetical protein